ncbi:hypothetical protein [Raoultella terrigena]|uniref:hypothetical protein n=1 Tax=Raoultella terrigena TaxID=577 RepID=UPI001F1C08E9|nr:hypothetical protein [Raoultella terrigena]
MEKLNSKLSKNVKTLNLATARKLSMAVWELPHTFQKNIAPANHNKTIFNKIDVVNH